MIPGLGRALRSPVPFAYPPEVLLHSCLCIREGTRVSASEMLSCILGAVFPGCWGALHPQAGAPCAKLG